MYNKLKAAPHLSEAVFSNPKNPDDPHSKDINLLHLACQEGFHRSAKYLNQLNSSLINSQSDAGWTPLMQACEAA
jgi:ankyrin repeat protein